MYNPEVLPVTEMCSSVATFTNVGHLISIYRLSAMDRTIAASGVTKQRKWGSYPKGLTLYLGKHNTICKLLEKTQMKHLLLDKVATRIEGC